MTHLLTLTTMRKEIRGTKAIRTVHVASIGILVAILIAALVPIGFLLTFDVAYQPSFPVWCLCHPNIIWSIQYEKEDPYSGQEKKKYNYLYVPLAVFILVYIYVTRVLLLFTDSLDFSRRVLRIPYGQPWDMMEPRLKLLDGRL